MDGALLIQFARSPVEGEVKTRMFPGLSPRQACELHCELVYWTAGVLVAAELGPVRLAVAGKLPHPLFDCCRELGVAEVVCQEGADLGERMYGALCSGLRHYERVVLVGSDCPEMDRDYLAASLAALQQAPLVLGPAEDGGYVLIGARGEGLAPEIFRDIEWGSSRVYRQTRARLQALGLDYGELPLKADIDRPQDLDRWRRVKEQGAWQCPLARFA